MDSKEIIKFINLPLRKIIKTFKKEKGYSKLIVDLYNLSKILKLSIFYMVLCIPWYIIFYYFYFSLNVSIPKENIILGITLTVFITIGILATKEIKIAKTKRNLLDFNMNLIRNIVFNEDNDLSKYDNILNVNSLEVSNTFKLRYILTPSEYVNKFKNEYLEENIDYLNSENKKYICIYHSIATFYFYLNQKILSNESDIKFISILNEIEKLSSKNKRIVFKYYYAPLRNMEDVVRLYGKKEYSQVYNILKEDSDIKFLDNGKIEYGKSMLLTLFKQYLVLLYISSKKINKELDFLPELLKERLEEALQEEDYIRFIERELKENL